MPKGVTTDYIFHDCIICKKMIPIESMGFSGKMEILPPSQYNKKQTCGPACKSELTSRMRTGTVRRKIKRKEKIYQYTLTSMDLYLKGHHLRHKGENYV